MRQHLGVAFSSVLLLAVGCLPGASGPPALPIPTPIPTAPPATPTPEPASAEEAVWLLVNAEAEGIARQDIELLMSVWAEDAVITDANHTPDNPDDDLVWRGREAIRERYLVLVLPSAPTTVTHPDLEIALKGSTATARSTTTIGGEIAPTGDYWTFEKKEKGGWKITGLTYNLEAK
jgi:ketosteroid isomerase-like protein